MSLRVLLTAVISALIATSCAGSTDETSATTSPPQTSTTALTGGVSPSEAVAYWVDTLAIGAYEEADLVVGESQVVLLIAVESYSPEIYHQLADEGVDSEMSRNFWASFVGGFEAFTGAAITDVVVGEERQFVAEGRNFAEVDLISSRGDATVIAMQDEGRWFVDVLATFGPSFSSLFNLWVERLPADATAPRAALGRQAVSLKVARDRLNPELDSGAAAELDRLLGQLGS